MAQHGYLHDEYDRGDFGHGDDEGRERSWRSDEHRSDWRDRSRDEHRGSRRGMMFRDDDHGRSSWGSQDDRGGRDSGFFSRMADQASGWFSDDDDDDRRRMGRSGGSDQGEWFGGRTERQSRRISNERDTRGGFGSSQSWQGSDQGRRTHSSHPDDHYRSWRDRQMQALDRDYEDYCREREQQFHSDFDSWRQNRQNQQGGGSGGAMSGTADASGTRSGHLAGNAASGTDELTLDTTTGGMTTDAPQEPMATVDPDSGATGARTRR